MLLLKKLMLFVKYKKLLLLLIGTAYILQIPIIASGQSSSPNYSIEESYIGPGGLLDANSDNYNIRASLGDTGIGNGTSASYELWAGYTTTDVEYIEMMVTGVSINLGVLTEGTTATTNGTFYVRNYISHGYVVTTMSDPPINTSYTMQAMGTRGASVAGTEQFGINLVANTAPATFGTDPVQNPDATPAFGFGYAVGDYNVTNEFKYAKGDIIARSDSSSGRTDYTISYIYNISDLTPGGVYFFAHDIVATATY